MLNILLSFFLAALVGIFASAHYGAEHLAEHAWVEQTIFIIMVAGVVNEAICAFFSSHLCRHAKWFRIIVCHSTRCNQS